MEIAVRIRRSIIVDDDVNTLNVDTTAKDVRCYQYTFLECFESSVSLDTDNEISNNAVTHKGPPTVPLEEDRNGCRC